jgi:hypothetical protein
VVEERRFYVYAYLRTRDSTNGKSGTPYYIGKGCGDRAYDSHHRVGPPKDRTNIIFLGWNLLEDHAFEAEKHFIRYYGRIDSGTGCLGNLTDGGEGSSGWVMSAESRRKHSERLRGRTITEEHRRKISESKKGKKRSAYSNEHRRKLSEAGRRRIPSSETRRKLSESSKAMWQEPDVRRKMTAAFKLRSLSEEYRSKMSEAGKRSRVKTEVAA